MLSVFFIRKGVSVGASGALFGLLGAMLSELITNWSIYTNRVGVSPVPAIRLSYIASPRRRADFWPFISVCSHAEPDHHRRHQPGARDTPAR